MNKIKKYIDKTTTIEDVFNFIQNTVEKELNEKDETLFTFRFQFWSDYTVGKGIRVNSTIEQECRVALIIYEYNNFLVSKSSSYSPFEKEKIDVNVYTMINGISSDFKLKTNNELFSDEIKNDEIYKKLFKSP